MLDRVFISADLVLSFPLCTLVAMTSLGSDHTPLIMDTGEGSLIRSNRFFFETGWFELPDFCDLVLATWAKLASRFNGRDVIDWWTSMSGGLRQVLRGWSRNLGKESRIKKDNLLAQIKNLDLQADSAGLDDEAWAFRYHLEEQLLQLFKLEEEHGRQRGRIRWALQGDANTAYFHAVANGKRRKCNITSLTSDNGTITGKLPLQEHIYDFYRELLGSTTPRHCGLAPGRGPFGSRRTTMCR